MSDTASVEERTDIPDSRRKLRQIVVVSALVLLSFFAVAAVGLWFFRASRQVDLKVTAPESAALGQLIVVRVEPGDYPHRLRIREVLPGEDQEVTEPASAPPLIRLPDKGQYVFGISKPGQYVIEVLAPYHDTVLDSSTRITVTGQAPGPPTPPNPPQPPTPSRRFALVVRETGESNPDIARLLVQLRTHPAIKEKHELWILDKDSLVAGVPGQAGQSLSRWADLLSERRIQLPALIVAPSRDSSSASFAGSLPMQVEEVVKIIEGS